MLKGTFARHSPAVRGYMSVGRGLMSSIAAGKVDLRTECAGAAGTEATSRPVVSFDAGLVSTQKRFNAHRRSFQPFSGKDEEDLVKVITTKPRHVLKHVRQLVWRSRKRELHFRNTVTQLMVTLQDFLRKQLIDPASASAIMEGILEECVKLQQHDMAHLLFRAFLRFRRFGCTISIGALRSLFDSYKGTDNKEMMLQLAQEMRADPTLRPFCIAAYLFAGNVQEAEAMRASVSPDDVTAADLTAIVEGYDALNLHDKVMELLLNIKSFNKSPEELSDVFKAALRCCYKRFDEKRFPQILSIMQEIGVPADSATFATILRMRLKNADTVEDIYKIEEEVRAMGYVPDMTGNSIVIAAYARMNHFGDRNSEEVMLNKVDTLLTSIETRLQQGDADLDISSQHLKAVLRGYGAAGRPDLMRGAWERMQKDGLSNDTRVYNELLKWYAMMGNVKDVIRTREEMKQADVHADAFSFTWIFRALGKYYPRQVEKYYQEMKDARIRADIQLFTTLIGVFGDLENWARVEELAAEVRKREENGTVPVSPYTYAQLIRVYSHDLDKAEALYREAKAKSVGDHEHVITTLLSAFAKHKDGEKRLDQLLSSLSSWSTNVYNVLLATYGKKDNRDRVTQLLDRMKRENVEFNEVTFGTLVTTFGRWKETDRLHEVIEMLKKKEAHITANFYSILAATYSRLGDSEGINDAWEDLMSSKLFPDTGVYNQFLALYGKHSNVQKMQTVMDSMLKQVPPNPLTATTVLDMLGKAGRISDMEALMDDMSKSEETAPTIVTYHQAMNAYAKTGDIIKMDKVRAEMLSKGMKENAVTFNILADGYGRAKRFEALQELIQRRKEMQIPMDELGYCVLIAAFGRVRMVGEVHKLAEQASKESDRENVLTRKVIWALIDAFCRCNDVTAMKHWVEELKTHKPQNAAGAQDGTASSGGLAPGDKMTLINYFCRAGLLDETESLVKDIEQAGEDVSFSALNAIARGYARAARFDKTVETLHKMRDRNMVPDASTALALSGAFVKAGLHEQAQQIVQWRRQYAKSHAEEADETIV